MYLINYDELDEIDVRPLAALPCDDVPLLRRCDDDVGFFDLLLGEMNISCQFSNFDAETFKPALEIADNLGDQSFHGSDVDDLELMKIVVDSLMCVCAIG